MAAWPAAGSILIQPIKSPRFAGVGPQRFSGAPAGRAMQTCETPMIQTALRDGGCGRICRDLLADLPEWFGIPESNAAYEADAETKPTWLARLDGEPVGLMVLKRHPAALEIWLMAARRDLRRHGVGRALVAEAEREARAAGLRYLTVKTRGPSEPYPPYDETRALLRGAGLHGP
jgi:GNAT superfamily N-acetyltransferase